MPSVDLRHDVVRAIKRLVIEHRRLELRA